MGGYAADYDDAIAPPNPPAAPDGGEVTSPADGPSIRLDDGRVAAGRARRWLRRHRTGVWVASGAVVGAVIAAVVAFGPRPPDDDLVEIVVVRKDLPVLTLLDESAMQSHLGRKSVRRDRLPAGALGDERLVLGKWVNRTIRAGEYLTDADVGHMFGHVNPDPSRALYVELGPDNRIPDTFKPGGRVDLFVGVRRGKDRVTSEPVVEGLLVLAVVAADHVLALGVTDAQLAAIRAAEYRGDFRAVRSALAE
jgi:hypothetical protein